MLGRCGTCLIGEFHRDVRDDPSPPGRSRQADPVDQPVVPPAGDDERRRGAEPSRFVGEMTGGSAGPEQHPLTPGLMLEDERAVRLTHVEQALTSRLAEPGRPPPRLPRFGWTAASAR